MENLEKILMLLFAAILLVGLAQKLKLPYPIVLVIGGTALGFIPGLNDIYFDSNLMLVIVLPPILYYGAFGISYREFQQNWRAIFSLALGLVAATTFIIGILFKWMFPQYSWALAFAFGAIVSPPDAIAATTILKRFAINTRLITLLEGESLVNDASALVLYKLAVVAILSGTFSFFEGVTQFVQMVVGGIFVGLVLGFCFQFFSRRYLEPVLGVVFSFMIPYITYIVANIMDVSGVLAVVVNGLIGSRVLLTHHSSLRRILGYASWDIFTILLNCFVFILIGLQLKAITQLMTNQEILLYTGYALLIAFAMLIVRMIWVFTKSGIAYLKALHRPKSSTICPQILRDAVIVGWSGMRGIVSLAAAIALPFKLPDGTLVEGRNEVIFITFLVILITLLLPGFSLPYLIRRLNIQHSSKHGESEKIRNELIKVSEKKLNHLLSSKKINEKEFEFLKAYFTSQHQILEMAHDKDASMGHVEFARLYVIQAQRKKILDLWESNQIDDKLLKHLEDELDVVEIHIARADL